MSVQIINRSLDPQVESSRHATNKELHRRDACFGLGKNQRRDDDMQAGNRGTVYSQIDPFEQTQQSTLQTRG